MKRYITILILLITAGTLSAQEVTFYTQAPRQVNIGQRFYLTFSINQEGIGFIGPEIQHFEVLSGPSVQTSSQIQNVNGKITQSTTYSYTFVLAANEAGTFTIPPAIITVKGKRYQSNTVTIMVNGQGGSQTRPGQPSQRNNAAANDNTTGNDIILKAICDKSNPYLGEQIIVTYKLYTPTNRLRINPASTAPAYPGFWAQDLMKDAQQYPQYNEVINGKKYIVAEIRKEALFPQKSGTLTITPFEQDVVYSVKVKGRSPFSDDPFFSNDPFFKSFFDDSNFGYEYQNVEKTLKSNPVTINVKPLPQLNKPINFTGAVGQFSMKPSLDRTEVKANEAITLKLTISGTGNLSLIEKPDINFPPDFEVYDPKITDNIHSTSAGISGSRTFEYLIIPRTAGDFKISPVQFAYFDLSKKDYVTVSSPEYSIKVLKGDGSSANAMTTVREDVKYVGSDIRHLMEAPIGLRPIGSHFYGSWLFWLLFSLPACLFLLFIILWRNHIRMNADLGSVRKRKATRIATMRLKKAKSLLSPNSQEAFYVEISQALWGYISDKFNVPLSELSMETAADRLTNRNVDSQMIQQFIDTLEHCEYARFAPGDKEKNMEKLYSEAIDVITHTEEQLK